LGQSSSGVYGIYSRGKSDSIPIFSRARIAGPRWTGIGHHDQQKSVECGLPEQAQTPYESMVSGTPAFSARILQDELHCQTWSSGSFLAGTL